MSGCRDNQYSYDARIDGTYHGAMTLLRAADHRGGRTTSSPTHELWDQLVERLADRGLRPGAAARGQVGQQARAVLFKNG